MDFHIINKFMVVYHKIRSLNFDQSDISSKAVFGTKIIYFTLKKLILDMMDPFCMYHEKLHCNVIKLSWYINLRKGLRSNNNLFLLSFV